MEENAPQKIGPIIRTILTKHGYFEKCLDTEILVKWPSLVGERIASVTTCTKVKDGIVYVRVANASWRHEISFLKPTILEKIKTGTKSTTIKDIIFF